MKNPYKAGKNEDPALVKKTRGRIKRCGYKTILKLTDLQQDKKNARKRTSRGSKAIEHSLRELGAGRSIVVDKHGQIVAGNGVAEAAAKAGIEDITVVQTDGTKLVVVQRTDLDLDTDAKAKQLAIADNRTAEFATWDTTNLRDLSADLDLKPFFISSELEQLFGDKSEPANNADDEWEGMPSYTSEDQTAFRDIIVHFANADDVKAFAELIDQNITASTKYVWYPKVERLDLQSQKYK